MEIVYFLSLPTLGDLRLAYRQMITTTKSEKVWNELFHLEYRYEFENLQAELNLQFNNITNNPHFIDFTQQAFSTTISHFQLRPRQFILSFIKKF